MPPLYPFSASLMTISDSMLNNVGEITHPCLTPLLILNSLDRIPAILTFAVCFLYSSVIRLIMCAGYPISTIDSHNCSCDTQSNAFLKSTKHMYSGNWCSQCYTLYTVL